MCVDTTKSWFAMDSSGKTSRDTSTSRKDNFPILSSSKKVSYYDGICLSNPKFNKMIAWPK